MKKNKKLAETLPMPKKKSQPRTGSRRTQAKQSKPMSPTLLSRRKVLTEPRRLVLPRIEGECWEEDFGVPYIVSLFTDESTYLRVIIPSYAVRAKGNEEIPFTGRTTPDGWEFFNSLNSDYVKFDLTMTSGQYHHNGGIAVALSIDWDTPADLDSLLESLHQKLCRRAS